MSPLDSAPVQSFLAAHQVAVLATLGPDGAPHATPMWFLAEPDAIYMLSVADTAKVRHLERDPRVSVAAETTAPGGAIRGVVLDGRAEMLADSADRRRLVARFIDKYAPRLERLWGGRAMPPDRVMFRIAPDRFRSWGFQ
jgi:PPOX class probable F420-dependent enzyme